MIVNFSSEIIKAQVSGTFSSAKNKTNKQPPINPESYIQWKYPSGVKEKSRHMMREKRENLLPADDCKRMTKGNCLNRKEIIK